MYEHEKFLEAAHRQLNFKHLPKYTSVGRYPLVYSVTADDDVYTEGETLCARCASEARYADAAIDHDVNYEDQNIFCVVCGDWIESAHAETCKHEHQDVNDRSQFVCLDCGEELGR